MSESDKKNELIPFTPTTLTRLNRELNLVDKLLEKIWTVKQKGIIEFYVEHSDFFLQQIAYNFALNVRLLKQYEKVFEWKHAIAETENIHNILQIMCLNDKIKWSAEMVDTMGNYDRHGPSSFKDYCYKNIKNPDPIGWFEDHDWKSLSDNGRFQWTIELIDKYEERLDFKKLSNNWGIILWSIELIEKYEDRWDWIVLSNNPTVPKSQEMIEKYEDRWDWERLSCKCWFFHGQDCFPWSMEFIEKYEDRLNFESLSSSEAFPWSVEFIKKYEERLNWNWLSLTIDFSCSNEIFETFKDNWSWKHLSLNSSLPWSIEFIDKYKDRWDWEMMSDNESIPWSVEFIEKYKDLWAWSFHGSGDDLPPAEQGFDEETDLSGLTDNRSIPWSENLFEKFIEKIDPCFDHYWISQSYALPWSIEFIDRYKDRWDWDELNRNKYVWEKAFADHVSGALIGEVMQRIMKNDRKKL